MGARLLDPRTRWSGSPQLAFAPDGSVEMRALGQSCVNLASMAGFETASRRPRSCSRRSPPTPTELARHPLVREKLMPVLGLVRSPSVEHALDVCELVTEHGGLGHTSAVYATDEAGGRAASPSDPHRPDPRQRADRGRRARRRLQLDDADVLARLRHLGRLGHHRQRQLPEPAERQDGVAAPGALAVVPRAVGHLLQPGRDRQPAPAQGEPGAARDRPRAPRRAVSPTRCARTSTGSASMCSPRSSPSRREAVIRARRQDARRAASRSADRGRRRLGDRRRQGHAAVPREPGADARRAHAAVPRRPQARGSLPGDRPLGSARGDAHHGRNGLGGLAGGGASRSDGRKATLVDYSLVPDMAVVEPRLTLSMPPTPHRGHRHGRAHACPRGGRVDLRLSLHGRVLRPGRLPDPAEPAAAPSSAPTTSRRARRCRTPRRSPASPSRTHSSA